MSPDYLDHETLTTRDTHADESEREHSALGMAIALVCAAIVLSGVLHFTARFA